MRWRVFQVIRKSHRRTLVLINPPDHIYLVTAIWAVNLLEDLPMPRHIRALSSGGTLRSRASGPARCEYVFPVDSFRPHSVVLCAVQMSAFRRGSSFELPGLSVTVESLDAQGDPAQVLYEFPVPLEDPSLRWMSWHDGVIRSLDSAGSRPDPDVLARARDLLSRDGSAASSRCNADRVLLSSIQPSTNARRNAASVAHCSCSRARGSGSKTDWCSRPSSSAIGSFSPRDAVLAAVALVAFCALSSFAYVLNDISDREADRLNPEKRDRPLARGDLTIAQAVCFAIALGAIAMLLSIALGRNFLAIAALYVALQFGYSLWAKQYVVLDVDRGGDWIRAARIREAGSRSTRKYRHGSCSSPSCWRCCWCWRGAGMSWWRMGDGAPAHRGVLAQYSVRLLDQMLAIVAGATLISYMIYTASAEVEAKLGTRYLYLTVPFVAFGILRYLYLVDARNEGGDPARLLIRDTPLLLAVLLWIAADIVLLVFLSGAFRSKRSKE